MTTHTLVPTSPVDHVQVPFAQFKRTACPALKIDAVLYKGQPLPHRQQIEHRLIWNMFQFLAQNGWIVCRLNDGEDTHNLSGDTQTRIKAAMEMVFNLDECSILFQLQGSKKTHWVSILLGNDGWDAIADHSYSANDTDNFRAVMEDFDCESFIEPKAEDFMAVDAEGVVIGSAEHLLKWFKLHYGNQELIQFGYDRYRKEFPL